MTALDRMNELEKGMNELSLYFAKETSIRDNRTFNEAIIDFAKEEKESCKSILSNEFDKIVEYMLLNNLVENRRLCVDNFELLKQQYINLLDINEENKINKLLINIEYALDEN